MRISYSANDLLSNLAQNLNFDFFIFDDPNNYGPQIKLIDKDKNGEIDAILYYHNIVCLFGINSGRSESVLKYQNNFFEKLDNLTNLCNTNVLNNLAIKVTTRKESRRVEKNTARANNDLKQIQTHASKYLRHHSILLRKIFFCPNRYVDDDIIRRAREKGNIIIDRDIYEYFHELLIRLNPEMLFNDFMHFLGIRRIDMEKSGPSRMNEPQRTGPFNVSRLPLEQNKIIMYSFSPRVEDISEYITVYRMAQKYNKKGFQRMVKAKRLRTINNDYLKSNETFPNNIIVALNPDIYKSENNFFNATNKTISLYKEYNSLIIIDGQHRLFSFITGGKTDRCILLTLIFIDTNNINYAYDLMDILFYTINKTQEKIDPNLKIYLEAKIFKRSEENFWFNVFRKLDKGGFFADRFSFKEATIKKERKKSIVSVIRYGGVLNLNKDSTKKGVYVPGLKSLTSNSRKEENIDFAYNLIRNYFEVIEKVMYTQNFDKNKLTPREIGALLRLITHFMVSGKNALEKLTYLGENKRIKNSKAYKYFEKIIGYIPFQDVYNLEYGASKWAAVEGYMLRKINRQKRNFGNKNLLSKSGLEVYGKTR